MLNEFPHLTSRLGIVEVCSDQLTNIDVWICLSEFESYTYGVISQYSRIVENLPKYPPNAVSSYSPTQLRLDIYYYTLTWDKLRKVYGKLRGRINNIWRLPSALPSEFTREFRELGVRMEHLLGELRKSARDEYEHPSLQPSRTGDLMGFGNLTQDSQGNIRIHVGQEEFAVVRKKHVDRLKSLWVELIDIFVKHFTSKAPSSQLFLLKKQIEEHFDEIVEAYEKCRRENRDEEGSRIFHQILISEIYLSGEGIPLRQDIREKVYSVFLRGKIQ